MEFVAFMPFLIPIVAILGWAAVQVSKNLSTGGSGAGEEFAMDLAALTDDLDEAHAERRRLRARIEALEAIVTEVDGERSGPLLDLDALPDLDDAAAQTRRPRTRS